MNLTKEYMHYQTDNAPPNYPCGWASDWLYVMGVFPITTEEYYHLAQNAMLRGGAPAYAAFTDTMLEVARISKKHKLHDGITPILHEGVK